MLWKAQFQRSSVMIVKLIVAQMTAEGGGWAQGSPQDYDREHAVEAEAGAGD